MRIWPGSPFPLGATWDGEGTNFAIFSQHAIGVELCLFSPGADGALTHRIPMAECTNYVWHTYLPDVRPGQVYGYRVQGPYDPRAGHRFNPAKLLLDPYAKAITGTIEDDDRLLGFASLPAGEPTDALDPRDSAPIMPKSMVVDSAFTWEGDRHPRTPWNRTVIYECHVRSLTLQHPDVPAELRGTYLALASDPIVDHLTSLGVTAVQLLPVHQSASEQALLRRGLNNHWGYNTLGYFAPDHRFATGSRGAQVYEFKSMVKALHRAGIEVLLDVVYNHTAEGDHNGPTLSLRGIDNSVYYRLQAHDRRLYRDFTGCGNTLNMDHPRTLQLVLDSLRYWVSDMHVDGFRFDLATTLGREQDGFDPSGAFFAVIQQDPVLSRAKLIAEPWDLGPGGYQCGNFPAGWSEWNDRYRDTVRRYWRGDTGQVADLAYRLSGSSDLFGMGRRRPTASINYVSSHDGFTLRDLVTYEHKHNEANGEHNRDGSDANYSRNWGVEGPTESRATRTQRNRLQRSFIATMAFSQGVPMLLAGTELGHTQGGNNNAYCQDNPTSWIDWEIDEDGESLLRFTRRVLALRARHPLLRRRNFFTGSQITRHGSKDLTWLRASGAEMTPHDWSTHNRHVLAMLIHGAATDERDERGRPIGATTLMVCFNGGASARAFVLPKQAEPGQWRIELDTHRPSLRPIKSARVHVAPHSLVLLTHGVANSNTKAIPNKSPE